MSTIRARPYHSPEGRISPRTEGVGKPPNVDATKIPHTVKAHLEPRITSP